MDPRKSRTGAVKKITWIGVVSNLAVSALKFVVGVVGSSQAIVADAVHSLSDLVTDFAILIGVGFWSAPPDHDHQFGHSRIEAMVTVGIGATLAIVALGLGYNGAATLWRGHIASPGPIALVGALLSIVIKEGLFRWTLAVGRETQSSALIANAWHHRSDALSSLPAAVAVGAALIGPGWAWLDPLGAIVVGFFILYAAWKIMMPAMFELSDGSASPGVQDTITALARAPTGVIGIHDVRTRRVGTRILVQLHVEVDGSISVTDGHEISEAIRISIREKIPEVAEVLVHVDPAISESEHNVTRP